MEGPILPDKSPSTTLFNIKSSCGTLFLLVLLLHQDLALLPPSGPLCSYTIPSTSFSHLDQLTMSQTLPSRYKPLLRLFSTCYVRCIFLLSSVCPNPLHPSKLSQSPYSFFMWNPIPDLSSYELHMEF